MQQTPLDRWLRKKFIYITRIYCNTLPTSLPTGLDVEEAPEESGGRFLYKMSTRSEGVLQEVLQSMRDANITYTSRVEDRNVWYSRYLNNPHKSFTYRCVWVTMGLSGLILSLSGLPQKLLAHLLDDGQAIEEVVEAPVSEETKIFHKGDQSTIEIDRVK